MKIMLMVQDLFLCLLIIHFLELAHETQITERIFLFVYYNDPYSHNP